MSNLDNFIAYKVVGCSAPDEYYASLEEAKTIVMQDVLNRMKSYYCDGCPYCCYGVPTNKKWCERRFTDDSELGEFLIMLNEKGWQSPGSVEEICFEKSSKGGYELLETTIWNPE
jgi:hypothetical protein